MYNQDSNLSTTWLQPSANLLNNSLDNYFNLKAQYKSTSIKTGVHLYQDLIKMDLLSLIKDLSYLDLYSTTWLHPYGFQDGCLPLIQLHQLS